MSVVCDMSLVWLAGRRREQRSVARAHMSLPRLSLPLCRVEQSSAAAYVSVNAIRQERVRSLARGQMCLARRVRRWRYKCLPTRPLHSPNAPYTPHVCAKGKGMSDV
jgi:hypothetical protein